MKRKKKQYSRPRKLYEKVRIEEENKLKKIYGLKNKTEIWKTLALVNYYRRRAKALAKTTLEEQEVLFNKLKEIGLKIDSISAVLGLKIEDLLNRRFSTVVKNKKLASTAKQARQMIVHKKVLIDGKVVNVPGYLVPIASEHSIKVKENKKHAVAIQQSSPSSEDKDEIATEAEA